MPSDANSRLVYSTGGDVQEEFRESKRQPRPAATGAGAGRGSDGGGVRLRLDRRASDRVVTTVSGLRGSEKELQALLKAFKTACGSGGTLKDGVVELQGDHRDKVEALLLARGVKSKRAGG